MLKTLEKLRRAPYHARERFTAIASVIIVGCITLIWFAFFMFSLLSTDFYKAPAPTTTSEVQPVNLQAPFAN